jgi:hypothetical protein
MQGLIMSKAASQAMAGEKLLPLVSAVSSATCQYLMMASTVNSTNIATGPGAGTQTGKIVGVVPTAMTSLMMAKAASSGLVGKDIQKLLSSIAFGVCMSLNSVTVTGTIIGAGPGTGTGKIVGLAPTALQGLIFAQESARVLVGQYMQLLVASIAFGICTHIMTAATVTLVDIGAFAPPPVGPIPIPAAPGIGRFS